MCVYAYTKFNNVIKFKNIKKFIENLRWLSTISKKHKTNALVTLGAILIRVTKIGMCWPCPIALIVNFLCSVAKRLPFLRARYQFFPVPDSIWFGTEPTSRSYFNVLDVFIYRLRVYNWRKLTPLAYLSYHADTVNAVDFSENLSAYGQLLAAGGKDARISLWSLYNDK